MCYTGGATPLSAVVEDRAMSSWGGLTTRARPSTAALSGVVLLVAVAIGERVAAVCGKNLPQVILASQSSGCYISSSGFHWSSL